MTEQEQDNESEGGYEFCPPYFVKMLPDGNIIMYDSEVANISKKFLFHFFLSNGRHGEDIIECVECNEYMMMPNSPLIICLGVFSDDDSIVYPWESYRRVLQRYDQKQDINKLEKMVKAREESLSKKPEYPEYG